eukprot:1205010-Amphidinium_carterae.1
MFHLQLNWPKTERVRPDTVKFYRLWSVACKNVVKPWREGTLDETFDLSFKTEARNANCQHQAGVFLDCSKCDERIPLA